MAMVSGILALAMIGADGPSCSTDDVTTFQVRVISLDGLDWRTAAYSRLQPVTRQGTSAIWTADRSLAAVLSDRASSVYVAGKVNASGDTVLTRCEPFSYVAAQDRVADGPINNSTAVSFVPRPERVEERFNVRVAGRRLDQGVLARVQLEETHVDAVHSVPMTETLKNETTRTSRSSKEVVRDVVKATSTKVTSENTTQLTASVQIPEISQTRIEGEWLIPKEGVLMVSLGVKTVADANGKAVERERLAIIEADAVSSPPVLEALPVSQMTSPPVPTRSIPQGVDARGFEVELPPLPEGLASADLDRIKPAPNQPSPQTTTVAGPKPAAPDLSVARTSFDAAPVAPMPPVIETSEASAEARTSRLKMLQAALAQAGFELEINSETAEAGNITLAKGQDKASSEVTFCPEVAGTLVSKTDRVASLGITIRDAKGTSCIDSNVKLDQALKFPGKTEVTTVPLSDQVSLEIKATVVPNKKTTSTPKAETVAKEARDATSK